MDSIDKKILEILQTDSMKTAKEMASELSLTTTPIYERIKKLENAGFIKQYVALLDADLINKNIIVFVNIRIKDHQSEERTELIKQVKKLKPVCEFYHVSGNYDYLLKVRFSTIKEFRDFLVNDISALTNISDVNSQIVLEEIKYTTKIYLDN